MEDDISGALTCTNNRMLGLLEEEGEMRERLPRGIQLYKKIHPRQEVFFCIRSDILMKVLFFDGFEDHTRPLIFGLHIIGTSKIEQEKRFNSIIKSLKK